MARVTRTLAAGLHVLAFAVVCSRCVWMAGSLKLGDMPSDENGDEGLETGAMDTNESSIPFLTLPWDDKMCGDPHRNYMDDHIIQAMMRKTSLVKTIPACKKWIGNYGPSTKPLWRLVFQELRGSAAYGTSCGDCRGYENPYQSQKTRKAKPPCKQVRHLQVDSQNISVCDDAGLDANCVKHDLARYWYHVLGWHAMPVVECKVVHDVVTATRNAVDSQFFDGAHHEWEAAGIFQCLFTILPCLAPKSKLLRTWDLVWPEGNVERLKGYGCMDRCYRQMHEDYVKVDPLQMQWS